MSVSEDNFGVPGSRQHTPAEIDEHAIVDGVHAKKVFPVELQPLAQTNPSYVLSYDGSNQCTQIDATMAGTTYRKTITWTGGVATAISVWSAV